MITTGFWCDECREKYVRHLCKGRRLPCGHSYQSAFGVECQAFGRGGEHVTIDYQSTLDVRGVPGGHLLNFRREDVWLSVDRDRNVIYGPGAITFWETKVGPFREGDWEMWVGEWLATKSDGFVRAFINRWDSQKFVPDWMSFREHPLAKRACAITKRQ